MTDRPYSKPVPAGFRWAFDRSSESGPNRVSDDGQ